MVTRSGSEWLVVSAGEFGDWAQSWQSLNDAKARSPALDARLIWSLINEFGEDAHLAVQGRREAPSAMVLVRRRSPLVWEILQPDFAPTAPVAALPHVNVPALLLDLVHHLPGQPQFLIVSELDPEIVPRPLDGPLLRVSEDFATHRITIKGSFEEYLKQRSNKFRANAKRRRNLLGRRGLAARLEVVTAAEQMAALVDDHARLERAGWKGAEGSAIDTAAPSGRFYRSIMTEFARTGEAIGYRYFYDDQIVATYLGIRTHGVEVALKWAYDETHGDTSPGTQLRLEMLRRMFDAREVDRFEFLGSGAWQRDWSDETRDIYQLRCYRSSVAAGAHRLWQTARRSLRRLGGARHTDAAGGTSGAARAS